MLYTINNGRFRLGARETGAELSSFSAIGGECEYEYIWQRCATWDGQSPLLFPIVGKLRDDTYLLNGRQYHMPKHGFARNMPFALESKSLDEMTFLLTENSDTLGVYPFRFELRVSYIIDGDGFMMRHALKNTSGEKMYFSLGAHPGFRCQMGDRVVMDVEETSSAYRLDKNALRAAETTPVFNKSRDITLTKQLFKDDALIFDDLKSPGATLIKADGHSVHVDFGGAPCLGLWAKPGAEYVCIEPWYGIDDSWDAGHDFTRKYRINSLDPYEEFTFTVTVTVM